MTSCTLNAKWRDTIFTQYAADLEADVPFPVRYLINAPRTALERHIHYDAGKDQFESV